tara:strand:+ start:106453 stop:108225 length:1773 start_codon:yes stop_codon:yes gene_type:complete
MNADPNEMDIAARPPRIADWLSGPMRENRPIYWRVALAALFTNLFALASSIFTMVVYDRVLPNDAVDSLIALSIGMAFVILFDIVLKLLRGYFTDFAGARVDRSIGTSVFRRLVAVRFGSRRGSTGAQAGLMRELETLRDFFASATITALVDVPFALITLILIFVIGGPLVIVPLVIIPLVILAGWLLQPVLNRLSAAAMKDGLGKQTVLVETIGGLETVKASGAAPMLEERWDRALQDHASVSLRQRLVSNLAVTLAQAGQMMSYVGVVIVGVGLVGDGELSLGGLLACSILAGRAVAPLTQLTQLLSRLTSARVAYAQIDRLMQQESEQGGARRLSPPELRGELELRDVTFSYPGGGKALDDVSLRIAPGEKVAIIGRVGSGKSTIARLLLGLYEPDEGAVLVDGSEVRQFEPDALRSRIGSTMQDTVLFSGTVRDNITLGRRDIDDEEMLRAARLSGTHEFMAAVPNGYEKRLADRGEGLSGGQRQSIAMARALAGRPKVLLFDEPSSHLDTQGEAMMLDRLRQEVADRTLVVITHRTPFLQLVDRLIVVDRGRIVGDGPRDEVLSRMRGQPVGHVTTDAIGDRSGR